MDVKYEANTLSYDKHSSFHVHPAANKYSGKALSHNKSATDSRDSYSEVEGPWREKDILFYYSTTSIQILTEDTMINFSNFVSAVGGNLGLFVGFSFLGFFSCFYKTLKRLVKKVSN